MKKILCSMSLMLLAIVLVGCAGDTQAQAGSRLSMTLDNLTQATTRVVTIKNTDLQIDELNRNMGIRNSTNNTTNSVNNVARNTAGTMDLNSDYQNNGTAYNRRVINNNAYNQNNSRFYNTNDVANNYAGNSNYDATAKYGMYENTNANNISAFDNQKATNRWTTNSNQRIYGNTNQDVNTQDSAFITDTGTSTNRTSTARYTPRFIRGATVQTTDGLNNYIERIEDLYMISLDSCAANDNLSSVKSGLVNCCDNSKKLVDKIKSGEVRLTQSQINTLNQYNSTLMNSLSNINRSNMASKDVQTIIDLKKNFSQNCDSLTAKYLKVLNNMDMCISSCNAAQSTVLELNNYVTSLLNNNAANNSKNTNNNQVNNLKNTDIANRNVDTPNNNVNQGNIDTPNINDSTNLNNNIDSNNGNTNINNSTTNGYQTIGNITNNTNPYNTTVSKTGNQNLTNLPNITMPSAGVKQYTTPAPSAKTPQSAVRNIGNGINTTAGNLSDATNNAVGSFASAVENKVGNLANGATNLINRVPQRTIHNQKSSEVITNQKDIAIGQPDTNSITNQNMTMPINPNNKLAIKTSTPSPISKKVRA